MPDTSTAVLPNAGFYQTAAGLLGVLLLTGVVAELRTTRDRGEESEARQHFGVLIFLTLAIVVLVGELAALTVLLRQRASPLLQSLVGSALILGLVGVPAIAFVDLARLLVSSLARRRASQAAAFATILGVAVVGTFVGQALLSGEAGVGTPTPPNLGRGQLEGGNIVRASLTGVPGASFKDPLDARASSDVTIGVRLSNGGPSDVSDVHVTTLLPTASGPDVAILVRASATNAFPGVDEDTVRIRTIGGRSVCPRYVPGSTRIRLVGGGTLGVLDDGIARSGVDIGAVGVALVAGRVVTFKVRLELTAAQRC